MIDAYYDGRGLDRAGRSRAGNGAQSSAWTYLCKRR